MAVGVTSNHGKKEKERIERKQHLRAVHAGSERTRKGNWGCRCKPHRKSQQSHKYLNSSPRYRLSVARRDTWALGGASVILSLCIPPSLWKAGLGHRRCCRNSCDVCPIVTPWNTVGAFEGCHKDPSFDASSWLWWRTQTNEEPKEHSQCRGIHQWDGSTQIDSWCHQHTWTDCHL